MKSSIRQRLHLFVYFFSVLGIGTAIYGLGSALFDNNLTTVSAQQDPFLSQRLNRIEQRFTLIESKIIQLEQQSRFPQNSTDLTGVRDTELRLLRSQVETLQLRIVQAECGLLQLDERTLSAAAKTNRKNLGTDNGALCRQTPNIPLQFSARP